MSTYKLWELANRDGVNALLPYVEDAVLSFKESQAQSLTRTVPNEVGEPMARYVHGKLMAAARPLRKSDPQPPSPEYTLIALPRGSTDHRGNPFKELAPMIILKEMSGGVLSDEECQQLSTSIIKHLRYYGLAESTRGTGRAGFWVRPWPQDLKWEHHSYGDLVNDWRTEKRIKEEADQPVKLYRSAKVVIGEVPDKVTPEWAVETIKRMAKAFDALAERYVNLETRYAELEAKYAEVTADPWNEATDQIKELVS